MFDCIKLILSRLIPEFRKRCTVVLYFSTFGVVWTFGSPHRSFGLLGVQASSLTSPEAVPQKAAFEGADPSVSSRRCIG